MREHDGRAAAHESGKAVIAAAKAAAEAHGVGMVIVVAARMKGHDCAHVGVSFMDDIPAFASAQLAGIAAGAATRIAHTEHQGSEDKVTAAVERSARIGYEFAERHIDRDDDGTDGTR